jgi:hypothetical protein
MKGGGVRKEGGGPGEGGAAGWAAEGGDAGEARGGGAAGAKAREEIRRHGGDCLGGGCAELRKRERVVSAGGDEVGDGGKGGEVADGNCGWGGGGGVIAARAGGALDGDAEGLDEDGGAKLHLRRSRRDFKSRERGVVEARPGHVAHGEARAEELKRRDVRRTRKK